jgi:hypothetical protein
MLSARPGQDQQILVASTPPVSARRRSATTVVHQATALPLPQRAPGLALAAPKHENALLPAENRDRRARRHRARFLQSRSFVSPTRAAELRTYTQAGSTSDSQPAARGRLALVVSSCLEWQQTVRRVLRAHGHAVVCVLDLDGARATVRQATPHVLIADLGPDLPALLPHLSASTTVVELARSSAESEVEAQVSRLLPPPADS